ncbi:hypothetical protein Tco_0558470 [Tanacetum coccineum]
MILCKQEEKGVPLNAEQGDWLDDTDEEPNKQELEAHYMYMEKIHEVLIADSGPTYDVELLEKLKKANASLTHELNECIYALAESNDIRDRCISALHDQDIEFEKYKKYKKCQLEKEEVERKYKGTLCLLAQKKHDLNEALKTQAYETFRFKEKIAELVHQSSLEHIRYDRLRKEKENLKKDFKIREEKDIDKLIAL